jgi:hypothetical protein
MVESAPIQQLRERIVIRQPDQLPTRLLPILLHCMHAVRESAHRFHHQVHLVAQRQLMSWRWQALLELRESLIGKQRQ